jgi:stage III sporulation protein SpoIIIAA
MSCTPTIGHNLTSDKCSRLPSVCLDICLNAVEGMSADTCRLEMAAPPGASSLPNTPDSETLTMLIVGMPNVGKSTLLNSLRRVGVNKGTSSHVKNASCDRATDIPLRQSSVCGSLPGCYAEDRRARQGLELTTDVCP